MIYHSLTDQSDSKPDDVTRDKNKENKSLSTCEQSTQTEIIQAFVKETSGEDFIDKQGKTFLTLKARHLRMAPRQSTSTQEDFQKASRPYGEGRGRGG